MNENKMSDIIKTSLDGIKAVAGVESAIGSPINTPNGVTVIPVSKVSIGFATGGLDFGQKKLTSNQNFGGGGGTGVSITPLAFLTIDKDADVSIIPVSSGAPDKIDHAISLIEQSPEIIKKIRDALT
jgi:sporulation protein YtfJ